MHCFLRRKKKCNYLIKQFQAVKMEDKLQIKAGKLKHRQTRLFVLEYMINCKTIQVNI